MRDDPPESDIEAQEKAIDFGWIIEIRFNANEDWQRVGESWFFVRSTEPMESRTLEECSEKAVEARQKWHTYEEGSMRLRNLETGETIPFEIFT